MDNYLIPSNLNIQRCPRCQHELNTIVVHGHEQQQFQDKIDSVGNALNFYSLVINSYPL